VLAGIACCVAPLSPLPAGAAAKVIHAFRGGDDGENPYAGLIADDAGDLYGTTDGGGQSGCCGTVFKLTNDRTESVLYAFKGGSDGSDPDGALMLDASGNLYGTTLFGGGGTGCDNGSNGCGTVFKLAPDGTETVLHAFQGGSDGWQPGSNIVMDQSGDLYGTTGAGGTGCGSQGCGTVFEVQPNGTKITLHQFQDGADGAIPTGPLIVDSAGNLYGTTLGGGGCSLYQGGCGTVFELTQGGQESILYAFQGGTDGLGPLGGVIMDGAGNLYGTTGAGGAESCCGVVFEVPAGGGSETVLYSFRGGHDGANPYAGVVRDVKGNLYGTTKVGGGSGTGCKRVYFGDGCGTVFKLTPTGEETVLAHFYKKHGRLPEAPLLLGKNGELYGTTIEGGKFNLGVVFKVKK